MKSVTLSSPEDKNIVRNAAPTSKIFTAGVARLHVASPDPMKWTYSQVWGAAIFCMDKAKNNSFFIRLVDLERQSGVIWEQELYEGFKYIKDAPFFHSFESDDCLTALEFMDEGEADTFYKKLQARNNSTDPTAKKRIGKIDKSHIGMPADFRHVGHVGYTPGKGFSIQNSNDPEFAGIMDQLKALGISEDEIGENQDFIQEFLQQNGTQLPPQANYPAPPVAPLMPSYMNNAPTKKKSPPPPPPPPGRHHSVAAHPPPPPPPRRAANSSAPPLPPPMKNQGPPVPNRGGRAVPPPPPGRPFTNAAPPQAPPPPPIMGAPAAPPPPSPSGVPPVASAGRTDLMASIRAAGGFGTLKQSGKLRQGNTVDKSSPLVANASVAATGAAAGAAGGTLASSLADVLKSRQQAMQSDDEDEEEDEWE